jgi:sugar O-acyltransferase (sialic acid O-acetyltransferase NeuD family)
MSRAPRLLIVFPYNGNGLEALDCLGSAYRLVAFVDDTPEKQGRDRHGHVVMGREAFDEWPDAAVLAVPGSPTSFPARRAVIEGLELSPERFARVIHPGAHVSEYADIGHNVLIMAGVVITSNASIGDHVCILPNSVVHHDARIGRFSLIGSNVTVAGSAIVGDSCYIGSGTSIMNGREIGPGSLVGLGSNVIRDVKPADRVAGNPARSLIR